MDATRARFGSFLEWLVAVVCMVAVLAVGAIVVGEFQTVSAVTPVIAHEQAPPDPPEAVPPRSVSVPVLLLPDGGQVRVGDAAADVSARLPRQAEIAPPSVDRTAAGERVTRFYELGGRRFAVVLAPLDGDRQVRVTGVYLQ